MRMQVQRVRRNVIVRRLLLRVVWWRRVEIAITLVRLMGRRSVVGSGGYLRSSIRLDCGR
jgi:hypothetical protein